MIPIILPQHPKVNSPILGIMAFSHCRENKAFFTYDLNAFLLS